MPINQKLLKECKERQDYREFNGTQKGLYPAEQAIFDNLPFDASDEDIDGNDSSEDSISCSDGVKSYDHMI